MFKSGFYKIAVSAKWIGTRSAGGIATRAGHVAGSAAHLDAKTKGGELFERMSNFYKKRGLLQKPPLSLVKAENLKTKNNPEAAKKELSSLYESLKYGGK